jgi:hypothetical protein
MSDFGEADKPGSDQYNAQLSWRRALEVERYLASKNDSSVTHFKISLVGKRSISDSLLELHQRSDPASSFKTSIGARARAVVSEPSPYGLDCVDFGGRERTA